MTLSKAKKHVASNYGYSNWTEAISDQESEVCEMMNYEAQVLVQLYRIDTGRLDYEYSINWARGFVIGISIVILLLILSLKVVQIYNEPTDSQVSIEREGRRSVGY
ncbi:hypothetical protein [Pedobacter sp. B4-66]|uniref:hypothetical protein n=1 Tax=Pedobacter sp. B4-66 TaxID=2817280 RepID=UPI001BDA4B23|nr:hypothetical protein [Pedobacter sp. B4-66]